MAESTSAAPQFRFSLWAWWRQRQASVGFLAAAAELAGEVSEFLRESTPQRRRSRYGDAEFDWDYRVDTTSGSLGWRERWRGLFYSPYQPTEPGLFHEMMAALPIDFSEFTFIDIGSGKGRALLLAAEYSFQQVIGVEVMPELHQAANENIAKYRSETQKCFAVCSLWEDARHFSFPAGALVVYLFNPLPEDALREMLGNLAASHAADRRVIYAIYHNPILEPVLRMETWLEKFCGNVGYSIYRTR